MDEGLLNDLLECSVCLERLDTSSRVLPCQHTFCLKCLKEIVQSHQELRCPECRVAVDVPLEELPPNVLLMRILEGMRHKRQQDRAGTQTAPQHGGGGAGAGEGRRHLVESKQTPHARVLYDYAPKEPGDLALKKGSVVLLHERVNAAWYRGESAGRQGIFPANYVQVMVALPTQPAFCKALYDFRMSAPDEEGCLAFDKGAVITVLRRVDDNWAEGRLGERVGIFPLAFVDLDRAARLLVHSHSVLENSRPIPSVPGPAARPTQADHRPHPQQAYRHQQMTLSTQMTSPHYQHIAMSQSHPIYHQPSVHPGSQILLPQQVGPTVQRHVENPKPTVDLIQFTNNKASVMRIGGCDSQLRNYDCNTGVHADRTKRQEHTVNLNNSDSSSTPSVSVSTSAPNSSNSSSDCTEPSSPTSPENTETNAGTAPSVQAPVHDSTSPGQVQYRTSVQSENTEGMLDTSARLNETCSTNTSLNVSLPPSDSPKLNSGGGTSNQEPEVENAKKPHNVPSSSRNLSSYRPSADMLSFAVSTGPPQAALSPAHVKETACLAVATRQHRDHHYRDREKRNSLTPASHTGHHQANPNRHSAEVSCAASLLEHAASHERRRRRSRSGDRLLPAPYVALYPYKPHKPDELELRKGAIYTVTERCQDGWYKGYSVRSQRGGVFPGNYVAPVTRKHHDKVMAQMKAPIVTAPAAPDAPPRTVTPPPTGQPHSLPWSNAAQPQVKCADKSKERGKQDRPASGVSLMRRLAAMKKCKSPPPGFDNPVFEDCPAGRAAVAPAARPHAVHVRSGSCPSQLLQSAADGASVPRLTAPAGLSSTVRARHARDRPSLDSATVGHAKHHTLR